MLMLLMSGWRSAADLGVAPVQALWRRRTMVMVEPQRLMATFANCIDSGRDPLARVDAAGGQRSAALGRPALMNRRPCPHGEIRQEKTAGRPRAHAGVEVGGATVVCPDDSSTLSARRILVGDENPTFWHDWDNWRCAIIHEMM
jgi:hypothetical protein